MYQGVKYFLCLPELLTIEAVNVGSSLLILSSFLIHADELCLRIIFQSVFPRAQVIVPWHACSQPIECKDSFSKGRSLYAASVHEAFTMESRLPYSLRG